MEQRVQRRPWQSYQLDVHALVALLLEHMAARDDFCPAGNDGGVLTFSARWSKSEVQGFLNRWLAGGVDELLAPTGDTAIVPLARPQGQTPAGAGASPAKHG